jgi:hypothetical protein
VHPAVRVLLAFAVYTRAGDQVLTVVWRVGDAIDVGI